jgi:hypothetical protein
MRFSAASEQFSTPRRLRSSSKYDIWLAARDAVKIKADAAADAAANGDGKSLEDIELTARGLSSFSNGQSILRDPVAIGNTSRLHTTTGYYEIDCL